MTIRPPQVGERILPWARKVTGEVNKPGPLQRLVKRTPVRLPRPHPFDVSIIDVTTSGSGFTDITCTVAFGQVFLSEDWDDVATITGLTTTECTLDAAGEGVYLKMMQTGEDAPTITLEHGATWSGYPQMWSYSPPESSSDEPDFVWYQRLAYLRAPRTGEPAMKIGGTELVLDQVVKTNLIRRTLCVEGVTAYRIPQLHPWY